MFFGKKRGIVSLLVAGCLVFTAEFETLAADPQSEAQAIATTNYETKMSPLAATWEQLPAMASMAVNTQEWYGKALANTDSQMNIFAEMSEESTVVGIMYSNTVVTVEEEGAEWNSSSCESRSDMCGRNKRCTYIRRFRNRKIISSTYLLRGR